MYANYLKLTVVIASLMFVTGFIALMVLSTTKVLPAQKGLDFEQETCRVTHSEISCATSDCGDGVREESKDVQTSRCLKVYVLCGDDKFINKNRNDSSDKQIGYLLRKDVHHLKDKVKIHTISYKYYKYHRLRFMIIYICRLFCQCNNFFKIPLQNLQQILNNTLILLHLFSLFNKRTRGTFNATDACNIASCCSAKNCADVHANLYECHFCLSVFQLKPTHVTGIRD